MTFNLYRIACTDDYQQSSESLGQFLEQEIDEAEIDKVLDSSVIMEYEGNRIVMDAGGIDYEHASVDTGLERSEAWREFTVYPQIIENNTDYNDLISLMEEKIDEKLPPGFLDTDRKKLPDARNIETEYLPEKVKNKDLEVLYLRFCRMNTGMF